MRTRVTVLGCGTSTGVPVIGCTCRVCLSDDPRNRRLRCGLRLEREGRVILIDTPPDLRQQALRFGTRRVDAVIYTHAHADHIFGLDDLRIYNFRQQAPIPCFCSAPTLDRLRQIFSYAFEAGQEGGGKPKIELVEIREPFHLLGLDVIPIPVLHGSTEVFGYRMGEFAYVTDCSHIPETSFARLAGIRTLILGALRYTPHPTHFSISEALAATARIGARRTYLTHLNHDVDYTAPELALPPGTAFAHDGLHFEIA